MDTVVEQVRTQLDESPFPSARCLDGKGGLEQSTARFIGQSRFR